MPKPLCVDSAGDFADTDWMFNVCNFNDLERFTHFEMLLVDVKSLTVSKVSNIFNLVFR